MTPEELADLAHLRRARDRIDRIDRDDAEPILSGRHLAAYVGG